MERILNFCRRHGLLLIFAAAFFIRSAAAPWAYYGLNGEMYRDLNVLYNWFFLHQWPLLGPSSSVGNFNFGPIYYYLLAPFYWLFRHAPFSLLIAGTFFSLAEIWIFYYLLKDWFGQNTPAVLGAFLLAFSFYDIQNAYYVSNPTLLPLFLTGFFYFLTQIIKNNNKWQMTLGLAVCLFTAIQLHATAALLLPVILLALFILGRIKYSLADYLLSVAVGAVLLGPYLHFELAHGFQNSLGWFQAGGRNFALLPKAESLWAILGFWDRVVIFKNSYFNLIPNHIIVYFSLLPLYAVIFIWPVWHFFQHPRPVKAGLKHPAGLLLSLWLSLGTVMFLFYQQAIAHFYFLVLWPVPIALLAWGIWWLKLNNRQLYIYALTAILLLQLVPLGYFFPQIIKPKLSYSNVRKLMADIKNNAGGQDYQFIAPDWDVNLQLYYKKLLGPKSALSGQGNTLLYLIYESEGSNRQVSPSGSFRQEAAYNFRNFYVVKFRRVP